MVLYLWLLDIINNHKYLNIIIIAIINNNIY
jgi:hypothetical protein